MVHDWRFILLIKVLKLYVKYSRKIIIDKQFSNVVCTCCYISHHATTNMILMPYTTNTIEDVIIL